jgi:hypothetical protein
MKTSQDVRVLGRYASDCCLKEASFDKGDTFTRCPRCSRLCEWELVESIVEWQGKINDNSMRRAG